MEEPSPETSKHQAPPLPHTLFHMMGQSASQMLRGD